jgi:hypothetical protein
MKLQDEPPAALTYRGEAGLRAITSWLKDLADTPQVIKRRPEKS